MGLPLFAGHGPPGLWRTQPLRCYAEPEPGPSLTPSLIPAHTLTLDRIITLALALALTLALALVLALALALTAPSLTPYTFLLTSYTAGTFGDYADRVYTFGLVACFGPAVPLATLIGTLITLIKIRLDAFKLCRMYQRPAPSQVS